VVRAKFDLTFPADQYPTFVSACGARPHAWKRYCASDGDVLVRKPQEKWSALDAATVVSNLYDGAWMTFLRRDTLAVADLTTSLRFANQHIARHFAQYLFQACGRAHRRTQMLGYWSPER